MSMNKVLLIGRLGADPELKYTPNGQSVCNFNMATSEVYVDKAGQKQEKTEWHRIVVWGKLGELCKQYLAKGRQAFVEGKIKTRSWDDKDGQKRYMTEVMATTVQFLGAGSAAGASNYGQAGSSSSDMDFNQMPSNTSFNQAENDEKFSFNNSGPSFAADDIPF